jgi:hypothetical protein
MSGLEAPDFYPNEQEVDDLAEAEFAAYAESRQNVPGYGLPAEDERHDCREFEVEKSTTPTRSGNLTVWGECEVCGRTTTPPYHDTIL